MKEREKKSRGDTSCREERKRERGHRRERERFGSPFDLPYDFNDASNLFAFLPGQLSSFFLSLTREEREAEKVVTLNCHELFHLFSHYACYSEGSVRRKRKSGDTPVLSLLDKR